MPTTFSTLVPGTPVTRRLAALLLGCAVGLGHATPAAAQSPDDVAPLEPVVVTATRRDARCMFFVSGFYYYDEYYEEHGNGTPLQFNHTQPAARRSAAASAHPTTANCASRPMPAESA